MSVGVLVQACVYIQYACICILGMCGCVWSMYVREGRVLGRLQQQPPHSLLFDLCLLPFCISLTSQLDCVVREAGMNPPWWDLSNAEQNYWLSPIRPVPQISELRVHAFCAGVQFSVELRRQAKGSINNESRMHGIWKDASVFLLCPPWLSHHHNDSKRFPQWEIDVLAEWRLATSNL